MSSVQGGEDAEDAITCRSLSEKKPLIIGLFCGKKPIQTGWRSWYACQSYAGGISYVWTHEFSDEQTSLVPIYHLRLSHVTHTPESCHTCAWVISHICMCHVTHESCSIYSWAVSHMCMSHIFAMSHMSHVPFAMSHMRHVPCMSRVTHVHGTHMHVTHIHKSHLKCEHNTLVPSRDLQLRHVTRMHESCPTCTYSHLHPYAWVTLHIFMNHATNMYASCHTCEHNSCCMSFK